MEHLVRFEENDLFLADIKEATIVTLFLLPQLNLKLKSKLLADLKPGTPIISNTFDLGDWKADKEVAVNPNDQDDSSGLSQKVFRWTVPSRGSQPK